MSAHASIAISRIPLGLQAPYTFPGRARLNPHWERAPAAPADAPVHAEDGRSLETGVEPAS